MLRFGGVIAAIVIIAAIGIASRGCNGKVLFGPSLPPQEPGEYFLVDGRWEKAPAVNAETDWQGLRISLSNFDSVALHIKVGDKLEWYTKYTQSELALLDSGLLGAMAQSNMADATIIPMIEEPNSGGMYLRSRAAPVATVINEKSNLSQGYTWYEFSAVPSPGRYIISYGMFAQYSGYFITSD